MDLRTLSFTESREWSSFPKLVDSSESGSSSSIALFGVPSTEKDRQPLIEELKGIHQEYGRQRREAKVRSALESEAKLSLSVQEDLLKKILKFGWGRLPHTVTRLLKSPTKYGLKLVDVAIVITIFDRTLAAVNSRVFEPIREQDFVEETGMDARNLREALKSLVDKGVILKVKVGAINFWGLNPYYFIAQEKGPLTPGKTTPGDSTRVKHTQGNVPAVKQGNSPCLTQGANTPEVPALSVENHKQLAPSKNLIQESRKESLLLLAGNFPESMLKRWSKFSQIGEHGKIEHEKKIFDELLGKHGQDVFDFCGGVVSFLEENGSGKPGASGKIYSPMDWIKGHWKLNLERYKSWLARKDSQQASEPREAESKRAAKIETGPKVQAEIADWAESSGRVERLKVALERFNAMFTTNKAIAEFAEYAFSNSDCDFQRTCWKQGGFSHPTARNYILEFFMATESEIRSACDQELSLKGGF